jgi:hypothetical protein
MTGMPKFRFVRNLQAKMMDLIRRHLLANPNVKEEKLP